MWRRKLDFIRHGDWISIVLIVLPVIVIAIIIAITGR